MRQASLQMGGSWCLPAPSCPTWQGEFHVLRCSIDHLHINFAVEQWLVGHGLTDWLVPRRLAWLPCASSLLPLVQQQTRKDPSSSRLWQQPAPHKVNSRKLIHIGLSHPNGSSTQKAHH